jgi:hypothetical protein
MPLASYEIPSIFAVAGAVSQAAGIGWNCMVVEPHRSSVMAAASRTVWGNRIGNAF